MQKLPIALAIVGIWVGAALMVMATSDPAVAVPACIAASFSSFFVAMFMA